LCYCDIPAVIRDASVPDSDGKLYFSYPMYRDLRDRNSVFSGVIATDWTQLVSVARQAGAGRNELVSGNLLRRAGVRPALGRLLVASADTVPNGNPWGVELQLLAAALWWRPRCCEPEHFRECHPFTVIGVAQPVFTAS